MTQLQRELVCVTHPRLTQTVVAIVCQAEAVVARAPVIPRDVHALVDAAAVVFGCTLIDICRETIRRAVRSQPRSSSLQ